MLYLNKGMKCQQKNNEKRPVFVSRFHTLASEHLMISDESSSSPVEKYIVIMLLNNENIFHSTITNAKSELMKRVELEKEHGASIEETLSLSIEQLSELRNINDSLLRVLRHMKVYRSDTENMRNRKAMKKMV